MTEQNSKFERVFFVETTVRRWDKEPSLGQRAFVEINVLRWEKGPSLGQKSFVGTRVRRWNRSSSLGQRFFVWTKVNRWDQGPSLGQRFFVEIKVHCWDKGFSLRLRSIVGTKVLRCDKMFFFEAKVLRWDKGASLRRGSLFWYFQILFNYNKTMNCIGPWSILIIIYCNQKHLVTVVVKKYTRRNKKIFIQLRFTLIFVIHISRVLHSNLWSNTQYFFLLLFPELEIAWGKTFS